MAKIDKPTDADRKYAKWLKQQRKARGFTIGAAAKIVGVSYSFWYCLETLRSRAGDDTKEKITKLFAVPTKKVAPIAAAEEPPTDTRADVVRDLLRQLRNVGITELHTTPDGAMFKFSETTERTITV